MSGPGRHCPSHYRYRPRELCKRTEPAQADVVYVAGGLYGNRLALDALEGLAARDRKQGLGVRLEFNGDFHWFDVDPATFEEINRRVLRHGAIVGNVELELVEPDEDAGCGCAYPAWIPESVVARSNRIIERLRATARNLPGACGALRALPRHKCLDLGGQRILILHGDPESLAGWGLARESLAMPGHQQRVAGWLRETGVSLIACSHTCLPALWRVAPGRGEGLVANNGSAGMGNLLGDHRGLVTRISRGAPSPSAVCRARCGDLLVELVALQFGRHEWWSLFRHWWPAGSPADLSYGRRIRHGTNLDPASCVIGPDQY